MAAKARNIDLTQGTIWKQLLLFALPLMASSLFQQLYNTMDSLIVGRFVGPTALAAVGSTGSLNGLVIGFFMGMGTGAGVIVSQTFGARDYEGVQRSVHTALWTAGVLGIVLGIIGYFITPAMLTWMQTPDDVFDQAVLYLRINFAGLITLTVYNMGAGILRAVGDSKRPLYYLITAGVTNVILNFIFVVFFHMGVAGVALATVISQLLSAVLVLLNLYHTHGIYKLHFKEIKPHRQTLWRIVRIGIPAGVQSMVISLSNIVIQSNINVFGSAAMAGNSAAGRIDAFVYLPTNSLALGVTTFVAQNVGAGKLDRVKKGVTTCMLLGFGITLGLGLLAILIRRPLIGMFTSDEEVMAYGILSMTIRCGTYFLFVPTDTLSGVIRGSGNAVVPMIISLVNMCLVRLVWLWIAIPIWHEFWVVNVCYPITWTLASLCYLLYYRGFAKKHYEKAASPS